jgi:flavin reductase (DIM6/NTAB) family NADH-FMN oxidoreductase RutF
MDPPMVLVSLTRGSATLGLIEETGRFGLNVLGAGQAAVAQTFAMPSSISKFEQTRWCVDHGVPRIVGSPGWVASEVESLVPAGDHIIVLGNVITAELDPHPPLVYHQRIFGTHQAHSPEQLSNEEKWASRWLLQVGEVIC